MNQAITGITFAPPEKRSDPRALAFSVGVHLLLVAALTWGVSWSTRDNSHAVEAELWQSTPVLAAAPQVLKQTVVKEDKPKPPPPEVAKPIDNTQALREAQLATAKLKKLEEEKLEKDRQARILLENERLKKEKEKLLKDRLDKEKAEKEKAEKEKAAKEKAVKEKLEKDKAEKEKQEKDKKAKEKTDKDNSHKSDTDDKKLAELRQEQLKRMAGMAGANGAPDANGTALRSGGPSAGYAGRITRIIKNNIVYPEISASENPLAEVVVKVAPDGTIVSKRLTKPSGNAAWDAAVLKAIEKTERFPRDVDGTVPGEMLITFKPNE